MTTRKTTVQLRRGLALALLFVVTQTAGAEAVGELETLLHAQESSDPQSGNPSFAGLKKARDELSGIVKAAAAKGEPDPLANPDLRTDALAKAGLLLRQEVGAFKPEGKTS